MNAVPIEKYKIAHVWVHIFIHVERLRAQGTVIIWEPEKSLTIILFKDPQRRVPCIADISGYAAWFWFTVMEVNLKF